MKKYKILFRVSLAGNFLFLSILGGGGYLYRDTIAQKVNSLFEKTFEPDEETLLQFNNEPLDVVNDSLIVGADKCLSILFLGNSITYCDAAEEDEDKTKRGLASTSVERDYVHCLVRMIADSLGFNVHYSIANIADFERTFARKDFNWDVLDNVKNKTPDILVVQIGENVSKDVLVANSDRYKDQAGRLLSLFPSSTKILTLPFWKFKEFNDLTTDIAIENNALIVDLSHLGADNMNYAFSQREYQNRGVGAHPGDVGMSKIAVCLYSYVKLFIR